MSSYLYKIAKVNPSELKQARKIFGQISNTPRMRENYNGFYVEFMGKSDIDFAVRHGINRLTYAHIINKSVYASFESIQNKDIERIMLKYLKIGRNNQTREQVIFRGFYANEHDDVDITLKNQAMLILKNYGHRIYSRNESTGVEKLLTPKSGDIVYLDIYTQHALIPNAAYTAKMCEKYPMEFYAFCYE